MAYYPSKELEFAEGYYHIDSKGVVTFADGTPETIIEEFWKRWVPFREKVVKMQLEGRFSSLYPLLPIEDPAENRQHYENR